MNVFIRKLMVLFSKPTGAAFSLSVLITTAMLCFSIPAFSDEPAAFPRMETETLDKEDFIFPDDLAASKLNIVLLAISEDQDNGTWQGDALLEWYWALQEQDILSEEVLGYHFSVMKAPFFVKGLIRGGMADSYEGKVPLDQSGAIFVKNASDFAEPAGITLDGQPTIVLIGSDGQLVNIFKGELSDEGIAEIKAAVAAYTEA